MAEEIRQAGLKFDPTTIGTSGLRQFGGYVNEEFKPELKGWNGARVYREMVDNDPIVGAIIFAITTFIRQVEWTVQAADDTPEADAGKEFLEEVMGDMSVSWTSLISEVCSMFVYGFAPMEIVWKRRVGPEEADGAKRSSYSDGKIGIRTIALRAQNTIVRWEIDPEDGSIDGMWQQPYNRGMVCIPIEKLLLFRTTEERNNPEGKSTLRTAYRPWFFKKRIEEIEAVGIERDLAGLPVAYIPGNYFDPSADSQEKATLAAWQKLVTNVKRDKQEGIVMPSERDGAGNLLFEIKLLSSGSARQFDTTKIIERYDKAIATSVLADFVLLGQGKTGSHALSQNKTDVFETAVKAFVTSIAEVFNQHLTPRLWRLNGMPVETMPSITPGDLMRQDISQLGDFVQKLTAAGAQMFPDRELENHLRQAAGLPLAPEDGEEGMGAPEADDGSPEASGGDSPANDGGGDGGTGDALAADDGA